MLDSPRQLLRRVVMAGARCEPVTLTGTETAMLASQINRLRTNWPGLETRTAPTAETVGAVNGGRWRGSASEGIEQEIEACPNPLEK